MAASHVLHFGSTLQEATGPIIKSAAPEARTGCNNTQAKGDMLLKPLSSFLCVCSSKLPSWARAVVPKIFYVTEKAWNYYPYTITGSDE